MRLIWKLFTLRSLMRALPDLALAALFLLFWFNPLSMPGVLNLAERIFLVEFALLFAFAALTGIGVGEQRAHLFQFLGFVLTLTLVIGMIALVSLAEGGLWPALALLLLVVDKIEYFLLPAEGRKKAAHRRMFALMGRGTLLLVSMLLPMMLQPPALGVTAEILATLGDDPVDIRTTTIFLATCVIYFGVLGALRTLDFGVIDRFQPPAERGQV